MEKVLNTLTCSNNNKHISFRNQSTILSSRIKPYETNQTHKFLNTLLRLCHAVRHDNHIHE
jgi:hypothetical protein